MLLVAGLKDESSYVWQDNSTLNTFQVKDSGTYTVKATNECGESTGSIQINMKNCFSVFIPTAFSPNEDGVNDDLQVFPSENVSKFHQFVIFNRWGDIVFSASEFTSLEATKYSWDGRFNGKLVAPDVFVYYIEYETTGGNILSTQGDVTVIR